ncbi:LysR family transcriptional regulator [Halomonas sp. MCCC 1A17488]|uniref:LysR family transcriptional regulator n=1 Tax=unclassified Halomonas TaxID=2609666 RepID=UPI0018D26415|nr:MULTISPECIES: LysR family transcriptional regulator [unclassified Halomonas]MCE8018441.1 LysR family transcriptional regulator [Halomonas sp. MCCC 1A17488]MCG3241774.1 LysR family transcriptional regulator [Halomonas sp. MCCC 1A17488]QPP49199.1 LysR family transcriptional regulator [Halomonas sp. SS10-MC5]
MEFRQLHYFVAVVEEGSISAASRRVHVAQPALTRQIRLLEEDLETRLFDRHARGMRLTVAGQALYEEAQELLDRRTRLRARLSALGQGVIGKVSLGVTVTHLWVPEVAGLLGRYRDRYPQVAFEVFPLLSGPQLDRLREGSLDAGILYLDESGPPGLETRLLQHDHLILAVPEASRWACKPPATLPELADADFVWGFRSASPIYFDRIQAHFQRLDFHPRVVQYGADNIAILSMVAAGLGIAILPAASSCHPMPGIRFVSLPELDACAMPLWFAWRPDNDSPALDNLIALVESFDAPAGMAD